jgi:hypothetical protein
MLSMHLGAALIQLTEGFVLERVVTALCLAVILWVVLFGGPVGEDGRLSNDAGKVAHLGY